MKKAGTITVLLAAGAVISLVALSAPPGARPGISRTWRALIERELREHPRAQVVDIYKLIYQGTRGIGHYLPDSSASAAMLHREIRSLKHGPEPPLLAPCNPDSSQFRVHLRPFLEHGYPVEALTRAMFMSVDSSMGSATEFARIWEAVEPVIEQLMNKRYRKQYRRLTDLARENRYPAFHHSDSYREAYAPAYRVLHRNAIETYFPGMLRK